MFVDHLVYMYIMGLALESIALEVVHNYAVVGLSSFYQ